MNNKLKKSIMRDFNKAANGYDEHAKIQRKAAAKLFSLIKNDIRGNQTILDAGCGTGYFHELLRKNKIYCPLIQADIAFNMCQKASEYSSKPPYGDTFSINSDIDFLPLRENSADLVFSSLTLQWANDLAKSLSEIFRVTKENGTIAINTLGQGTLFELAESFQEIDDLPHINSNFITKDIFYNAVLKAGFKDIEILEETISEHHENVHSVMRSIKGVGASYKSSRPTKYLGKEYFAQLDNCYKNKFANEKGLPASWNILYVSAKK